MITDMVGQTVKVGSKVVAHGTRNLVTGEVIHLVPLFATVRLGTNTTRRIAPWQLVVFGAEIRGNVELVA